MIILKKCEYKKFARSQKSRKKKSRDSRTDRKPPRKANNALTTKYVTKNNKKYSHKYYENIEKYSLQKRR